MRLPSGEPHARTAAPAYSDEGDEKSKYRRYSPKHLFDSDLLRRDDIRANSAVVHICVSNTIDHLVWGQPWRKALTRPKRSQPRGRSELLSLRIACGSASPCDGYIGLMKLKCVYSTLCTGIFANKSRSAYRGSMLIKSRTFPTPNATAIHINCSPPASTNSNLIGHSFSSLSTHTVKNKVLVKNLSKEQSRYVNYHSH